MLRFRFKIELYKIGQGMIRMNHAVKICLGALSLITLAAVAQADEFKLSNNQRISCSRGARTSSRSIAASRSGG